MCAHDGGVPLLSSWSGNSSDSVIFRKRAKALIQSFKKGESPRYLVADSKLYDKQTISTELKGIPYITRVPRTISLEKTTILEAIHQDNWTPLDASHRYTPFEKVPK